MLLQREKKRTGILSLPVPFPGKEGFIAQDTTICFYAYTILRSQGMDIFNSMYIKKETALTGAQI